MACGRSSEYVFGECVGSGQFGQVYLAKHVLTSDICVCKVVPLEPLKEKLPPSTMEVAAMCRVEDHPNIVKLLDCFEDEYEQCLVMELCSHGDLFDHIANSGPLEEESASLTITQLAQALHHCHKRNVLHRDVKPENVLISRWRRSSVTGERFPVVKLGDFGSSLVLRNSYHEGRWMDVGTAGTLLYMAPELLSGEGPMSDRIDIWSLGVVLYVCLTGSFPFHGVNKASLWKSIHERDLPFPRGMSSDAIDLVMWMLEPNPKNRPSLEEVLHHKWIKQHLPAMEFGGMSSILTKSVIIINSEDEDEFLRQLMEPESPSNTLLPTDAECSGENPFFNETQASESYSDLV